jgi:DNA/RNA endonuclease YhcR with UshA esterase domain
MKEKTLLKIALIISLLGISLLFLISDNIEIKEKNIDKINKAEIGEKVKIKGMISNIVDSGNVMIIEIIQPSKINVIIFKENDEKIKINISDYVEVIGSIGEYKGEKEVIVDRLRVIR